MQTTIEKRPLPEERQNVSEESIEKVFEGVNLPLSKKYTAFVRIKRNKDGSFARTQDSVTGEAKKKVSFLEKWGEATIKTSEQIQKHFKDHDAGIALLTGEKNGITVLDFDEKDNPLIVELYDVAPTLLIQTEKGFHFYYQYSNDSMLATRAGVFGKKVDVRNDGGLVFCPPTPNYTVWKEEKIQPLTEEGLELLRSNFISSGGKADRLESTETRNDSLFRKACGWIEHYPEQEAWKRMVKANRDFRKGELDDEELEKIFQQARKYKSGASLDEKSRQSEKGSNRYLKLAPEKETTFEKWGGTIQDRFPDLAFPAEIGLSVIAQLLIRDITNPFALVYVDAPSSGKTITLNFFSELLDLVYTTDDFTPASFVSHSANTKKEDLEKNDLLPRIRYKTLVVRDLAPIFAKRDEDAQAMLGILTRVLDGEGYESNSGLWGKRGYAGDYLFMMLAASTPIRPRIWKAMGNLGSRLFFLNIGSKEKDEETLAEQLEKPCKEKEAVCRTITTEFLKTLWSRYPGGMVWNISLDDTGLKKLVGKIAKILAKLRAPLNVWKEESTSGENYEHTQVNVEHPDRINQLLYNLARGHALVCGREKINEEDIDVILRVALDSGKPMRTKLFKGLLENNGSLKTSQVMDILKCSTNTALKAMEEMRLLEIVSTDGDGKLTGFDMKGRPETTIRLNAEYQWLLEEKLTDYLQWRIW